MKAEASIYLDISRPKVNGLCAIKIRITYMRLRKYFPLGYHVTPDEFDKIMNSKRKTVEQRELYQKLSYHLSKANTALVNLKVFTFDAFEEAFLEQRNVGNSVSYAFDKYIEQLQIEKRIGSAESYKDAKKSIETFKKDLTFAEIDKNFLQKYENAMLKKGNSLTTIGIYLRELRAIYNQQNIDKSHYPFGNGKNKYSIPKGKNIKKALTVEEIAGIYNYQSSTNNTKNMAKDYWIFLYLCNGMNVKDFCMLKWGNIDGDTIIYKREKTKRSKKDAEPIRVIIKDQAREIIRKWGKPSIVKEDYIFPHLIRGMSAEEERNTYKQLNKIINKYMKLIAVELGINKEVTTYFARHSFATVLKRSGAKIEMISELLGHSSVEVTKSYLDSFEKDQIQKETDALIVGFDKITC